MTSTTLPADEVRTYYDHAVLKPPAWKDWIPAYFFCGGLSGASAVLAFGADLTGRRELARRLRVGSLAAIGAGSLFLVVDLGRPLRMYNMLRVVRPTSPMSVGSWLLAAFGTATGAAAATELLGILPRVGAAAAALSAALGPAISTYTAVLVADTAVPVWHEARRELPFLFAGSSAASAGALGCIVGPPEESAPARRLAVAGAALELGAHARMDRTLGELAEPYESGPVGLLRRASAAFTATGAAVLALASRRSRGAAVAGGALILAGSATERFAVFRAGFVSARDPKYVVGPQRRRLEQAPAT